MPGLEVRESVIYTTPSCISRSPLTPVDINSLSKTISYQKKQATLDRAPPVEEIDYEVYWNGFKEHV